MKKFLALLVAFAMTLSFFGGVVLFGASAEATLKSVKLDTTFTDKQLRTIWKTEVDEAAGIAGISSIKNYTSSGDNLTGYQIAHDSTAVDGSSAFGFIEADGGTFPFLENEEYLAGKNIFGDMDITNKPYLTFRGHGYETINMEHILYLGSTTKNVVFATEKTKGYMQAQNGKHGWYDAYIRFDLSGLTALEGSEKPGAPLSDYIGDIDYIMIELATGWFVQWLCGGQKLTMAEWSVEYYVETDELRDLILLARENGVTTPSLAQAVMVYADQSNTDQTVVDEITAILKAELDAVIHDGEGYKVPGFSQYTEEQLAHLKETSFYNADVTVENGAVNFKFSDEGFAFDEPLGNFFGLVDISNKDAIRLKVEGYDGDLNFAVGPNAAGGSTQLGYFKPVDGYYTFPLDELFASENIAIDQLKYAQISAFEACEFTVTEWKVLAKLDTLALYNAIKTVQKYGPVNVGLTDAKLQEATDLYANRSATQDQINAMAAELNAAISSSNPEFNIAKAELNELLNTADSLGFFDDDTQKVYDACFEADAYLYSEDITLEGLEEYIRIIKGYVAGATFPEGIAQEAQDLMVGVWKHNYTEESFKKMLVLFDVAFYAEGLNDDEITTAFEQAKAALELIKIATHTIPGVTEWEDFDIDDLLYANIGCVAENMGDGIHYSNDYFYMTVENGIKYFNMEAVADKSCMGYKNFDDSGTIAPKGKGGAYPTNNFFGDMTGYDGIRVKVKYEGELESFNFRISNCSFVDGIHMEAKVLNVPAGAIGPDGYITLPFEIFVDESWGSPLNSVLDKAIVMIMEANNVTEGTVVSFGDFHLYNDYTFGLPKVTGIENLSTYDVADGVSASFAEGTATLNGEKYTSGTSIEEEGEYLLIHTVGDREVRYVFNVIDSSPAPVITGVEDGKVYDLKDGKPFVEWDVGDATLNGNEIYNYISIGEVGKYTLVVTNGSKSTTVSFEVVDTRILVESIDIKIDGYKIGTSFVTISIVNDGVLWSGSGFAESYENAKNRIYYEGGVKEGTEYWAIISPVAAEGYILAELTPENINVIGAEYEQIIVEENAEGATASDVYIKLKALEKPLIPVTSLQVAIEGYIYGNSVGNSWYSTTTEGVKLSNAKYYTTKEDAVAQTNELTGGFDAGIEYWLTLDYEALEGYDLSALTASAITLTGGEALEIELTDTRVFIKVAAIAAPTEFVPNIEVSLDGYELGGDMLYMNISINSDGVVGMRYFFTADGESFSGKFEAGVEYIFSLVVVADEGYEITAETAATLVGIEGVTATVEVFDEDSYVIHFALPALEQEVMRGDFDGDGKITVSDALAALRIAARMVESTDEALAIGDIDGDGKITVSDSLAILRVAAKMAEPDTL